MSGGGVSVTQSYALRVQPGSGGLVRRTVRTLDPGASVTLSQDLVADLVPGTAETTVSLTTLAALDVLDRKLADAAREIAALPGRPFPTGAPGPDESDHESAT